MSTKWEKIAWAPTENKTRILVYREGYAENLAVCYFDKTWNVWTTIGGSTFNGASHWMPLPELPELCPVCNGTGEDYTVSMDSNPPMYFSCEPCKGTGLKGE